MTSSPTRPAPVFPVLERAALFGWVCFVVGSGFLLRRSVDNGELAAGVLLLGVAAICLIVCAYPGPRRRFRRALTGLFLLAYGTRLASAALFDYLGSLVGDIFSGSSDAWAYDQWARRLVDLWSELRWVPLERWDQAGRWDIGFHYVLGAVYTVFGQSVLVARAVVALFGALAVLFFFLVARRLVDRKLAQIAALAYALWPTSIAWTGYSILRDPLVWALLFLSVWLLFVVVEGRYLATPALALALLGLRMVRPYAFLGVVIGLAVAAASSIVRRDRRVLPSAVSIGAALLAVEVFFFTIGFPSVPGVVRSYFLPRAILHSVARSPAAPHQRLVYPGERARFGTSAPEEPDTFKPPARLFGPSIPANTARFLISPPAWAPVRGDIRHSDNWQLPGMWAWYLILPLAAIGFGRALTSRTAAIQVLFLSTLCFVVFLILAGHGDSARQREMVVPFFLLAAALGLELAEANRKRMIVGYVLYAAVFMIGIAYHRHTLRQRGMIESQLRARAIPAEIVS